MLFPKLCRLMSLLLVVLVACVPPPDLATPIPTTQTSQATLMPAQTIIPTTIASITLTPLPVTPSPTRPLLTDTPSFTPTPTPTRLPPTPTRPAPTPAPLVTPIAVDADGKVFWGDKLLVDTTREAPGCTSGEISASPTGEHFLLVLACPPDGTYAEYAVVFLFEADGSGKRAVTEPGEHAGSLAYFPINLYFWAPNGKWLFYTRLKKPLDLDKPTPPATAELLPDGVVLYNVYTGAKVLLPEVHLYDFCSGSGIYYSPTFLYFVLDLDCGWGGTIYLYRADGSDGKIILESYGQDSLAHIFYGWSPDGQWLMYNAQHAIPQLTLYNVRTNKETSFEFYPDLNSQWYGETFLFYPEFIPQWSPAGNWLAFSGPQCGGVGASSYEIYLNLVRPDGNIYWVVEADFPPGASFQWEQSAPTEPAILYVGESGYRLSPSLEALVPLQERPPKNHEVTGYGQGLPEIRSGPGTGYPVIDQLGEGSQVEIIGPGRCLPEPWFPVQYNKEGQKATGWISGRFWPP